MNKKTTTMIIYKENTISIVSITDIINVPFTNSESKDIFKLFDYIDNLHQNYFGIFFRNKKTKIIKKYQLSNMYKNISQYIKNEPEYWNRIIKTYLLLDKSKIIGIALYTNSRIKITNSISLNLIVVNKNYQHKHLGYLLLVKTLQDILKQKEITQVLIGSIYKNIKTYNLYNKLCKKFDYEISISAKFTNNEYNKLSNNIDLSQLDISKTYNEEISKQLEKLNFHIFFHKQKTLMDSFIYQCNDKQLQLFYYIRIDKYHETFYKIFLYFNIDLTKDIQLQIQNWSIFIFILTMKYYNFDKRPYILIYLEETKYSLTLIQELKKYHIELYGVTFLYK